MYQINWFAFKACVRLNWKSRYAMQKACPSIQGGATRNALWHGLPVGLIPYLVVCQAMDIDPLYFLREES